MNRMQRKSLTCFCEILRQPDRTIDRFRGLVCEE